MTFKKGRRVGPEPMPIMSFIVAVVRNYGWACTLMPWINYSYFCMSFLRFLMQLEVPDDNLGAVEAAIFRLMAPYPCN